MLFRSHNAHLKSEHAADAIRVALVRQIESPVRWVDTIRTMVDAGVDLLVECGPGKVLTNLNKRIAKDTPALAVFDPESLRIALAAAGAG